MILLFPKCNIMLWPYISCTKSCPSLCKLPWWCVYIWMRSLRVKSNRRDHHVIILLWNIITLWPKERQSTGFSFTFSYRLLDEKRRQYTFNSMERFKNIYQLCIWSPKLHCLLLFLITRVNGKMSIIKFVMNLKINEISINISRNF